jgi:hypothetical protein
LLRKVLHYYVTVLERGAQPRVATGNFAYVG